MVKRGVAFVMFAVVSLCFVTEGHAQTQVTGTTVGGAYYNIVVPSNWNGDLVIWNHGFSLNPIAPLPNLGPLQDVQFNQGYAVASSSYRTFGWAVFKTNKDLKALVEVFKAEFGTPGRVILSGASLGGLVSAAALEKGKFGKIDGALLLCGAVAGGRNWDGALDLRLTYDALCAGIPDAAIPGGTTGLPKDFEFSEEDLEEAVNACTGVSLKKSQRSSAQKANLKTLLESSRIPEEFLLDDMRFATLGLADLIHDKGKLKGKQGVGNLTVDYGDSQINSLIERVEENRKGVKKLAKNFTPKGRVKGAKIVSIHTDKDGLVVVENQSAYAAVVPEQNLTVGITVESSPTHCAFTAAEGVAAWISLEDWLDGDPQPDGSTLAANCELARLLVGGDCRFDPNFQIPDFDSRIRPR